MWFKCLYTIEEKCFVRLINRDKWWRVLLMNVWCFQVQFFAADSDLGSRLVLLQVCVCVCACVCACVCVWVCLCVSSLDTIVSWITGLAMKVVLGDHRYGLCWRKILKQYNVSGMETAFHVRGRPMRDEGAVVEGHHVEWISSSDATVHGSTTSVCVCWSLCLSSCRISGLDRSIYLTAHLFISVAPCLSVCMSMSVCKSELQSISTLTNLCNPQG